MSTSNHDFTENNDYMEIGTGNSNQSGNPTQFYRPPNFGLVSLLVGISGIIILFPVVNDTFLVAPSGDNPLLGVVFIFGLSMMFGIFAFINNSRKARASKKPDYNEAEHSSKGSYTMGLWGFWISLLWPLAVFPIWLMSGMFLGLFS